MLLEWHRLTVVGQSIIETGGTLSLGIPEPNDSEPVRVLLQVTKKELGSVLVGVEYLLDSLDRFVVAKLRERGQAAPRSFSKDHCSYERTFNKT